MARKSRKETAAVVVQEADAACRAAIYVRLSVSKFSLTAIKRMLRMRKYCSM